MRLRFTQENFHQLFHSMSFSSHKECKFYNLHAQHTQTHSLCDTNRYDIYLFIILLLDFIKYSPYFKLPSVVSSQSFFGCTLFLNYTPSDVGNFYFVFLCFCGKQKQLFFRFFLGWPD